MRYERARSPGGAGFGRLLAASLLVHGVVLATIATAWFGARPARPTPSLAVLPPALPPALEDDAAPPVLDPPVEPEPEIMTAAVPLPRPVSELGAPPEAPARLAHAPPAWVYAATDVAREEPPPPPPAPGPVLAVEALAPPSTPAPVLLPARRIADDRLAPPPSYPAAAQRRGQEGVVVLRARVAADGSLLGVEVADSSGWPLLDEAALHAVRAWPRGCFAPATRDGAPIAGETLLRFRFVLQPRTAP